MRWGGCGRLSLLEGGEPAVVRAKEGLALLRALSGCSQAALPLLQAKAPSGHSHRAYCLALLFGTTDRSINSTQPEWVFTWW